MRSALIFLAGSACLLSIAAAASEQDLPGWKEGNHEPADWVAGGDLLAAQPAAEDEKIPDIEQPKAGELDSEPGELTELPEKFWPAYFAERPKTFLIDPQGILSPVDMRERLEFLKYHAGDSAIDLYVYVFRGDQEIPGEVREEELVERFFATGRPAAVVFFFMGAPERSVLHLSPSLIGVVPVAEQRRSLESSVMQALNQVEPSRQLETFLVQMSIRIYWMERMLGTADSTPGEHATPAKPATRTDKKSRLIQMIGPYLEKARAAAMPAGAGAAVLLGLLLAWWWLKSRARHRFPDFDVEPRLGGAHAAGVGGVISFASASLPPASQRDQMMDHARR